MHFSPAARDDPLVVLLGQSACEGVRAKQRKPKPHIPLLHHGRSNTQPYLIVCVRVIEASPVCVGISPPGLRHNHLETRRAQTRSGDVNTEGTREENPPPPDFLRCALGRKNKGNGRRAGGEAPTCVAQRSHSDIVDSLGQMKRLDTPLATSQDLSELPISLTCRKAAVDEE